MSTILDEVNKWEGYTEGSNGDNLNNYLKTYLPGTWVYDVRTTPWCAAFANAILIRYGALKSPIKHPLTARSFLNAGTIVHSPQEGDIVVLKRGTSTWQGHVGFYVKDYDEDQIIVFGGNQFNSKTGQSDQVNKRVYSKDRVLGYRRFV